MTSGGQTIEIVNSRLLTCGCDHIDRDDGESDHGCCITCNGTDVRRVSRAKEYGYFVSHPCGLLPMDNKKHMTSRAR